MDWMSLLVSGGAFVAGVAASAFGQLLQRHWTNRDRESERERLLLDKGRDERMKALAEYLGAAVHSFDRSEMLIGVDEATATLRKELVDAAFAKFGNIEPAEEWANANLPKGLGEQGRKALDDFFAAWTQCCIKATWLMLVEADPKIRDEVRTISLEPISLPQSESDQARFATEIRARRAKLDALSTSVHGSFALLPPVESTALRKTRKR